MVLEELGDGEKFMAVLEWMIALGHRQSGVLEAGLVYVTYDPLEVRDLTFGASDTVQQLGVIQNCLRSAFRQSDLICRDGVNFWILAPFTQMDPVLDKVQRVIKSAPENGLSFAKNNFHVFMLKDYVSPGSAPVRSPQGFLQSLLQEYATAS
jgi:hypothetical protein